jgi:NhaP-type Na+/H+ or K+/H+ antiporter
VSAAVALPLAFALLLLTAVLISERAGRSVLSTTVVFLVGGALLGPGALGWIEIGAADPLVGHTVEAALVTILYLEGLGLDPDALRRFWHLPTRALVVGLPVALVVVAVGAHLLLALPWGEALLLGAVLSPTDPVLASALLRRDALPGRVRHLLSIESGLNDALALPFVAVFLAMAAPGAPGDALVRSLLQLAAGVALGVAVPLAYTWLERTVVFGATRTYRPLGVVGVGLALFALSRTLGGNQYLAAFAGGFTLARRAEDDARDFHRAGRSLSELVKLAAVFLFGCLVTPSLLTQSLASWLFAAGCLLVARPLGAALALGWSLSRAELAAVAWFGPKGFSSVVFALMTLGAGLPDGGRLFQLAALVIALSMVAHSSTDFLVARSFERRTAEDDDEDGS